MEKRIWMPVAPVAAAGKTYVIFYRIDADTYLYPLVKSWPGPSRSAETLLVAGTATTPFS